MKVLHPLFRAILLRLVLMTLMAGGAWSGAMAQGASPAAPVAQSPATPVAPTPQAPADTNAPPAAPPAPAEPPPPVLSPAEQRELEDMQRPVTQLKSDIERLEKAVERSLDDDEELARLRAELSGVFDAAKAARDALAPKSAAIKQQIDQLGPAPAKDAAPEAANVMEERARLNAKAAEIDGALKNIELTVVRAHQLRDTLQQARQELFASQVLKRGPSPAAPATWQSLMRDLPGASRQVAETLSEWSQLAARKGPALAALVGGVLLLMVALVAFVRRLLARQLDTPRDQPPGFFAQAATVGWMAPLLAVPGLVSLAAFGAGLDALDLLRNEIGKIAETAFPAAIIFIAVSAMTRAILQPRRPAWRLVNLSTSAARTLTTIIGGIAAVFSLDLVLQEVIARLYIPLSISIMETALACLAIGLLMLALVKTRFEPKTATAAPAGGPDGQVAVQSAAAVSPLKPFLLKLPILIAAVAILTLTLLGYIGLGRFITQQVVVTGSAIAVVLVFHLAIRAMLGAPGTGIKPFETVLQERAGLEPAQSIFVTRAISVLLNVALALAAVPLILLTWGYTLQEALSWIRAAVFGFQIGEFRISFARIMLAALLFLALVFVTRLVQRWLDAGFLNSKRIDQGIANSIHTAVGYAGFIIAVLAAISYSGVDITSFAIVAGALSVGIGLGLQSIVNNFVSGLILLVERPIKVGDRVAVGDSQGYVRRISVRSTEIETLDKASLIVPNSELVTSKVTNWTHRNALGTATVRVTVSGRADAEQVRDLLLKVGAECPGVLQHPAPSVALENLGLNGLEFSLGTVVPDVTKAAAVQSDLRFRILKTLRDAGVEMAHAQSDVHLRDLDSVRSLLTRLAEERAR